MKKLWKDWQEGLGILEGDSPKSHKSRDENGRNEVD